MVRFLSSFPIESKTQSEGGKAMAKVAEDAVVMYEEFRREDPLWQKYERCCVNLEGIERKLANGVPPGKKEALEFQRKLLREKVIPRVIAAIQQI
jgi:hypothetical protein